MIRLTVTQAIAAPWRHPGIPSLDLPSLLVETNARLAKPLKFPGDMRAIVTQLQQAPLCVRNLQGMLALALEQWVQILASCGIEADAAALRDALHSVA